MVPHKKGRGPLRVDYKPTNSLKPHPQNSRTHTPGQIDEIIRSIQAVGWTKPIIVDEKDEILAGHGKDTALHPTMKPVALARRAIVNSTKEGEIVLDMFAGASSTIMGAEQTKRVGYAIELDPHYVDASVRRWQELTGKEAIHATEKKTYQAIAKARGKA